MRSRKPILVTGINRSGSTWIGQTLSRASHVRYFHEPFNVIIAKEKFDELLPRWFHSVSNQEEYHYEQYIKRVLSIPNHLNRNFSFPCSIDTFKPIFSRNIRYYLSGIFGIRTLVKDPIAIFSAEWLASKFSMDVVVVIRHPASYVWSLIKDPSHLHSLRSTFLEQPILMRRLKFLEKDIILFSDESYPLFERAAVFWKATHLVIKQYQESNPNWIFCRYEDIAENPVKNFEFLSSQLNLKVTPLMLNYIQAHALNNKPEHQDYESHVKSYDSAEQYQNWKNNLSSEQIQVVKEITSPVSDYFYTDNDW